MGDKESTFRTTERAMFQVRRRLGAEVGLEVKNSRSDIGKFMQISSRKVGA
jgi:hypothetical protein